MPCTNNCNQGRACKCKPLHDSPPIFPAILTGFVLGAITAIGVISLFHTI